MMFKVLIVDDEGMERKGLQKIISDAYNNAVIEEAENGRTAILKAEDFRPDVVFMDIKMPGIDGIEAAKEIKQMYSSVQIIMVTAFDTFEYAREAMKIGVKDYILKPSTREEILSPLKRVLGEMEREKLKRTEEIILKDNYRRALSIVQSRVITSMLIEASNNKEVIELELEQTFQKESFVMVLEFKTNKQVKDYQEFKSIVSMIQTDLNHYYSTIFIGEESIGRIPVLIQIKELNHKVNIKDHAIKCGNELIKKLSRAYPEYELSIGIGRVYDQIEEFVQSYHEALFALTSIKKGSQCQYFNNFVREKEENEGNLYPYQLEKRLLETVISGEVSAIPTQLKEFMGELISFCNQSNDMVEEKLSEFYILLGRQLGDSGLSISINRRYPETNSMAQLQSELMSIANHIHTMYYSSSKDILLIAKNYIADHSSNAITLEEVAEVVKLSPQYFSKIFKERTGSSFIDYLTKVRVEKAKGLMRTRHLSVKEVCYEVGYKDPNYFSRVFKKITGISPSEFRQLL